MDFKEYQEKTSHTAIYKKVVNDPISYLVLGLSGESGEVAEKLKKIMRDHEGVMDEEKKESLKKELGDVLWYVSQLSAELGFSLEEVAETNIKKLASRKDRNTLSGKGDDR